MLRMIIEGVGFDQSRQTVVVLKDWEGQRLLPIWIGPNEAKAIALELEGAQPSRPLSYDLLLNCLSLANARVARVVINDLQDSTFYATIDIDTPQGMKHIDSRPSDAIAVAVRVKCPVFVDGGAIEALVEINEIASSTLEESDFTGEADFGISATENGSSGPSLSSSAAHPTGEEEELDRFKRLIGDLDS